MSGGVVKGERDRPILSGSEVSSDITSGLDRIAAKESGVEVVASVLRQKQVLARGEEPGSRLHTQAVAVARKVQWVELPRCLTGEGIEELLLRLTGLRYVGSLQGHRPAERVCRRLGAESEEHR